MTRKKLMAAATLALLWGSTVQAAVFSDLPDSSRYAASIEYLVASGIISGYPDNTFRPDQNVNRVEFLKIALGASGIEADESDPTGFPDVDETAWYAKYVREAKKEGWIEGYPDGTFKPEQFVNKAEALKIISGIQEWNLSEEVIKVPFQDTPRAAWYTRSVEYAKNKNFLEETGDNFYPEATYSRAKISELLFRTYITEKSGEDVYSTDLINLYPPSAPVSSTAESTDGPVMPAEQEQDFSAEEFKMYTKNFFEDVELKEDFPNTFYLNEVYFFDGIVDDASDEKAFVFIAPPNVSSPDDYTTFIAPIEHDTFLIPVVFREPGNYRLGLILGESGESKVVDISVLPAIPEPETDLQITETPLSPGVFYKDQRTTFSWDENDFEFIRVIIFQADETKIFYFRQGIENFDADYPDFEEFGEGTVNMWVEGANLISEFPLNVKSEWSEPVKKTFTAATHQYTFHGDELSIPSLPETFLTPQTITIEGTTNTDIFVEGAVIRPDGFVDTVNLKTGGPTEDYYGAEIISAGNSFTYAYQPAKIGTYNVEINGTDGSAVLNSPVYISQGVPLIPDFFDLNRYARPEENFNLSDARTEMLKLINEERIKVGRAPIVMDDELNTLAQLHSKDMLTRNFFSHINPDGETPNDRRKELDIATSVSENLAISPTVLYTHKGLMQSAVHRRNIIDDAWSKVGIGIVTQTDGSLITTEEFSGDPLDESDFSAIRNEILSQMNEIRSAENISSLWVNTDLQAAANEWSDIMAAQEFFDFTAPNGETLSGIVQDYVPDKAVQALILESSGTDKLISEAAQSEDVTMSQWTKVGIGLAADAIGTIKATILFTTN